jgi:hypothetical protein
MQSVVGSRPEYANMQLVAIKTQKKWEGWEECRKLKELEVRANAPFLDPTPLMTFSLENRHYLPYPLIQISYPCTTLLPVPRFSVRSSRVYITPIPPVIFTATAT